LPFILKERDLTLKNCNLNKIFCAQWLDDRKILMGTKCNSILIMDTTSGRYAIQSPIKSHPSSKQINNHCGIHSIAINPSRTMLATGAENVNDIGKV
jgi:WD repeat-containing protein 40A